MCWYITLVRDTTDVYGLYNVNTREGDMKLGFVAALDLGKYNARARRTWPGTILPCLRVPDWRRMESEGAGQRQLARRTQARAAKNRKNKEFF